MPRRRRIGLIGPLASWDLLRLVRRGQAMRARAVLAGGLLVALTLLTAVHFPHQSAEDLLFGTAEVLTIQASADFGDRFALTVLFTQLGLLCLLAPAYAAGAIAEEKERHTFTLLLVSDLTGWEIFAGLLAGRTVFLVGVLAAGLPVLAGAMLYGGVSLLFVGMCYLLTTTTVLFVGALSAAAAATAETYRGALLRAYGLSAMFVLVGFGTFFLSPFAVLAMLYEVVASDRPAFVGWGLAYAGVELVGALVATLFGVARVRQMRARPRRVRPAILLNDRHRAPVRRPARRDPDRRPPPTDWRPPVSGRDPFRWKERYIQGSKRTLDDDSLRGFLLALGLVLGIVAGVFVVVAGTLALTSLGGGNAGQLRSAGRLLVTAGVLGHLPYLIVAGAAAGRSVIVERQRNTLESLLAIPVDRRAILGPKWRAAAATGVWWGLPSGLCLPLGLACGDQPLAAIPSLVLAVGGGPLAASVGLWLSLRCRTATRALLWWLPAAAGLGGVQILLAREASVEGLAFAVATAGTAVLAAWRLWAAAAAAFERMGRE
jgi:ABC-type transport system involved in multi-copper enzyme maturation permease subunit